jgi:predicted nuclease of predicted toxin-antitoxin system
VSPRFLLDEHISPHVARGCQERALDVVSLAEAGVLGAYDLTIFRHAIAHRRIVVTYNTADFARLLADLLREGARIPGVVFVDARTIPTADIGGSVRALVKLASLIEAGEVDPSGGVFLTR